MTTDSPEPGPFADLALPPHEVVALAVSKLWLMHEERRLENNDTTRYLKALVFGDFATALGRDLRDLSETPLQSMPETPAGQLRAALASNSPDAWDQLVHGFGVVEALWDLVAGRDRARLIAIEVAAFAPWGDPDVLPTNNKEREKRLSFLGENLHGELTGAEVLEIDRGLRKTVKELLKRPPNLLRLGALGVGGAAIGVVTGGLAAPAVGSAIGSAMGLGGAAAAGAGLAFLGGGSLASGGLGMAGGAALIAGTAAIGGGAAAVGAGRMYDDMTIKVPLDGRLEGEPGGVLELPATAEEAAVDGAKLCVWVEQVVLAVQEDEDGARRILEGVEESRDATLAMVERLGGGNPSSAGADELTRIGNVLKRTAGRLAAVIESHRR